MDTEAAEAAPLWTLHLAQTDWELPTETLSRTSDEPVWPVPSTGGEPFTLVLVWSERAFDKCMEGGYSWQAVVDDSAEYTGVACGKRSSRDSGVTLHKCFEMFSKEEVLDADNAWYCPKCKMHREGCRKRIQFWSLPPLLVVQLKRFSAQVSERHSLAE